MSSPFNGTEGIILKVIPFRDYDQILVLFTEEVGLLKVLYKGSRSKRRGVQGLCMPLIRVEVIYKETRGEIFSCQDLSLIDSYSALRQNLAHLETACSLLQLLYQTQWVGKPAPRLYALLKFYLEKIPFITHLDTLAASFHLKLLKHEGVLAFPFSCSLCQGDLQEEAFLYRGGAFCCLHKPVGAIPLQEKELELLYKLTTCPSYHELNQILVPEAMKAKIGEGFKDRLRWDEN